MPFDAKIADAENKIAVIAHVIGFRPSEQRAGRGSQRGPGWRRTRSGRRDARCW